MRRLAIPVVFLAALPALALDPDAEGCKDSPVISRFPNSRIYECSQKDFDEAEIPTGKDKDGNPVNKTVEGAVTKLTYQFPDNVSLLETVRNYQNALTKAGFSTVYEQKVSPEERQLTVQAKKGGGPLWVHLHCYTPGGWSSPLAALTIVQTKEMEQKIEADASALLTELNKSGHVAVYGINFDTGKATITDDSAKVLEEIGKLLKDNSELKLRVEGHTDNVGSKASNLELSKKRAAAVKNWVAANAKIDAARMTTEGFGDSKPIAANDSDEGRAKNRRVELVKLK